MKLPCVTLSSEERQYCHDNAPKNYYDNRDRNEEEILNDGERGLMGEIGFDKFLLNFNIIAEKNDPIISQINKDDKGRDRIINNKKIDVKSIDERNYKSGFHRSIIIPLSLRADIYLATIVNINNNNVYYYGFIETKNLKRENLPIYYNKSGKAAGYIILLQYLTMDFSFLNK